MAKNLFKNLVLRKLQPTEQLPFKLLLQADSSRRNIEKDLGTSEVYVALLDDKVIGVYMLYLAGLSIELKNVVVDQSFRKKGLGRMLLDNACQAAKAKGYNEIQASIANSSISQLSFYQKAGFDIIALKKNFFLKKYPEPIIEDGIQSKHLFILSKEL